MDDRVREVQRAVGYHEEAVGQSGEAVGPREKEVEEREKAVEQREQKVQGRKEKVARLDLAIDERELRALNQRGYELEEHYKQVDEEMETCSASLGGLNASISSLGSNSFFSPLSFVY